MTTESWLDHHFENAKQQYESQKLGLWLFMLTEVLMFGGIFVGYALIHQMYPESFAKGSELLDSKLGFLNTLVLISSSLTMALGVYYTQMSNKRLATRYLAATLGFAVVFLVVKAFEYEHKIHDGLLPGYWFSYEGVDPVGQVPVFFAFYFFMTGIHGLHVVIGMALIAWVLWGVHRGRYHSEYFTPVEGVGIFWHVVDLIWIYLFPVLYLIG